MKIIVSYRRSDSSATAGRIYDHLLGRFGQNSVFMDVDAIPFGTDFRSHIKDALLGSDILLAVMGPNWLGPLADGTRRIDDEADPVRVEVETALTNGITVVPVLIDGTPMPGANQLPAALRDLAFLNAAPVDMGRDFRLHVDRLARALETILAAKAAVPGPAPEAGRSAARAPSAPAASRTTTIAVAGFVLAALLGAGAWIMLGGTSSRMVASATSPVEPSKPVAAAEPPKPVAAAEPPKPVAAIEPRPASESPAPPVLVAPPAVSEPVPQPAATAPAPAGPGTAPGVTRVAAAANRSKAHGTFAWYELWTTDASAAQTFYRNVLGWSGATTVGAAGAYTILSADRVPVAGLATLPANVVAQGVKPSWIGYVTVTNVDASAAEAKDLAGAIHLGPADVPGIGRYALAADPQGGSIALFKGLADPPPPSTDVPVGHAGWRELRTPDRASAVEFYGRLFAWSTGVPAEADGAMPLDRGGTPIGAIRPQPAGTAGAVWIFAFQVGDLTSAMVRVVAGGGRVVDQARSLPGGRWIVTCTDPQGASFALMSRTR